MVQSGIYLDGGWHVLILAGIACSWVPGPFSQEWEGCFAFSPFLLPGSCPDDVRGWETKALFSCQCAQEWPRLPSLSHLPSEDDQIMSHTSRLRGTQETPLAGALAPSAYTGPVCPCGLQGGSTLGPTFSSEGRAHDGRPRLPLEATCYQKAHLLQPDMKSGFFPQLTWLTEGEAGLFRMRFGRQGRQEIQRRMSL